jgi:serine protease Do
VKIRLLLSSILAASILALSGCVASNDTPNVSSTSTTSATVQVSSSPALSQVPTPLQSSSLSGSVAALEAAVESIYAEVNPSVVNIQVMLPGQGITSIFPGFPSITPSPSTPSFSSAEGSGFVWDMSGHIITNNHVVDGASRITVTFYDGTTVDATLVGTDPDSDLAVIKVDVPANQLHPVKMADSNQLKVGQLAIAIGNPFGLQGTMTVGFISSLGRVLPANSSALGPSYSIPDVIQTDASINPGNSGGVLLDGTGNVMGITFAIDTNSGTSAGVGFAIPSAIVQQVVPSLIASGKYDHPWLGISIASMNPDLAAAMNLSSGQKGALVSTVTIGSPADKAGLQASTKSATINGATVNVGGDIITAFNSQSIKTSDDLISALARSGKVGQTITLTILRSGQEIQVQVTLAARLAA